MLKEVKENSGLKKQLVSVNKSSVMLAKMEQINVPHRNVNIKKKQVFNIDSGPQKTNIP